MKLPIQWHWGYLAIILLLGLLWYEFLNSSNLQSPPAPIATLNVPGDSPIVAPSIPAPAVATTSPVSPVPLPTISIAQGGAITVEIATPATAPSLPELAPISLSVNNATCAEVVDALNRALGVPNSLPFIDPNSQKTYTLNVKDKPFWEVFKALNDQDPFTLSAVNSGIGRGTRAGISNPQGANILRRFVISGPAILYPGTISVIRSGTGISTTSRAPGTYTMTIQEFVDPRLTVASFDQLAVLEAIDNNNTPVNITSTAVIGGAGGTLIITGGVVTRSGLGTPGSNFNTQTLSWPESDTPAKSISLKAELRFASQSGNSEISATLDDAQTKVGDLITLGDRHIRLARFNATGTMMQLQLAPDTPGPQNGPISFSVTDSTGRTLITATNRPLNSITSFPAANSTPPYRLTLRAADRTKDYSLPFELRDIPLP